MNMDSLKTAYILLIFIIAIYVDRTDSTCQIPTAWQNKSWYMYRGTGDPNSRAATRRDFVVGVSEIYGMKAAGYAAVVQNWTCYYRNTNDNIIAFKGSQLADFIGTDSYLYTAFQINDSFSIPILYPRTNIDPNVYDERVVRIDASATPTIAQIATLSATQEFYFLLEKSVSASQFQDLFVQLPSNTSTTASTTTSAISATTSATPTQQSNMLGVIVAISVIGACLIVLIIILIVLVLKKNNFCICNCSKDHHSTNQTGDCMLPAKTNQADDSS